jgi:hypothetical protein
MSMLKIPGARLSYEVTGEGPLLDPDPKGPLVWERPSVLLYTSLQHSIRW